MAMFRDVYPVHLDSRSTDTDRVIHDALQKLWRSGAVTAGDRVIVTMGDQAGKSGGTNTLRLVRLDSNGESTSETELDLG
jgi:pyruvate kinase